MHYQRVTRGGVASLLMMACLGCAPLAGQQRTGPDPLAAVVQAMFFRSGALGDSLPFDACSVWEQTGRPAALVEGVLPGLRPLLDRQVDDPCSVAKPSEGSRFERIARVDSVVVADSAARVHLHIRRGEWSYQEVYHLARRNGGGWSFREVRMYPPIHVTPPPTTQPGSAVASPVRHEGRGRHLRP
jgi:hypothetical protein